MADPASSVVLRPAQLTDVPQLHRLIELSVRVLGISDYTPAQIEGALGHALGLDTRLVEDGTYFVLTTRANPVDLIACGGWSRRRTLFGSDGATDRDAALLDPAREPAKIRAIFVHPQWSRRVLCSRLLLHGEDQARAAGFRTAEMGSTLTGVPLYTLRGYAVGERLHVPLPNGEVLPVVRMTRNL